MFNTPVLLLVFNRPEETRLVFEAIRKAAPRHLYIAADGPRINRTGEKELCDSVQQIVQQVDWPCEVTSLIREQNLGCRKAVSEAITWFFTNVEQGIIIEDDCLPDGSFFPYCEQLLEKYKDDEAVFTIGGTNLGYHFNGNHSYSFSRFMNMWGWATWRRSAVLVDYNMEKWKAQSFKRLWLQKKLGSNFFTLDYNWIKYWKSYFTNTTSGEVDTWDYQWIFTQLYYNKVSVFPAQNLVKNIGFSDTATHTFHNEHPVKELELSTITFPLIAPADKLIDLFYEDNFIKKVWFNYSKETLYRILRSNFLNKPRVTKTINFFKSKKHTSPVLKKPG